MPVQAPCPVRCAAHCARLTLCGLGVVSVLGDVLLPRSHERARSDREGGVLVELQIKPPEDGVAPPLSHHGQPHAHLALGDHAVGVERRRRVQVKVEGLGGRRELDVTEGVQPECRVDDAATQLLEAIEVEVAHLRRAQIDGHHIHRRRTRDELPRVRESRPLSPLTSCLATPVESCPSAQAHSTQVMLATHLASRREQPRGRVSHRMEHAFTD
jgi:hypothetical protein